MSVRDSLLAILSLGPAYGLQLHAELRERAPHRGPVNVGQIYSTLDRLGRHGLVEAAGVTADGLPLYRLTADGSTAADAWMTRVDAALLPEWTGMLDQVLVTATVDCVHAGALIDAFEQWWRSDLAETDAQVGGGALAAAARLARRTSAVAALDWLEAARAELAGVERMLDAPRPRRGRRPASAA